MVNFLELVYVLAALNAVMVVVSLRRRRPEAAARFGVLLALCAVVASFLSWHLSPAT